MRNLNLCLHTGASTVDLDTLRAAPTPEPTKSWRPIPHTDLLERVRTTLDATGLHVVGESHGLAREGARYFGLLAVANGENADDFGLVVGVRNSHDKSFPAGLCLGSQVFVCDNLAFRGEVKLARKHTTNILRDLSSLCTRAVGRLGALRAQQSTSLAAYRGTTLSDRDVHHLLITALDARILPVTSIPDVLQQWRKPSHPEHAVDGPTVWRLFNSFTEVLKGNLNELPRRTIALQGLLDSAAGLILPQTAPALLPAPTPADVPETAQAL